ncbi:hypothetical protein LJC08_04400 [Methanimicrococcus sp. OttesenSCG-928-J09]|nr:hypothetical protein [Methanimicrococcus sp. OttesenSCG-928-J09]
MQLFSYLFIIIRLQDAKIMGSGWAVFHLGEVFVADWSQVSVLQWGEVPISIWFRFLFCSGVRCQFPLGSGFRSAVGGRCQFPFGSGFCFAVGGRCLKNRFAIFAAVISAIISIAAGYYCRRPHRARAASFFYLYQKTESRFYK